MTEQHGFIIAIETIEQGSYEDAFKAALAIAEKLNNEMLGGGDRIIVTETGLEFLSGADGVFCEGCEECVFPGIRWPTAIHGDNRNPWVERCDTCERFKTDLGAAAWLVENYGPDVATLHWGRPIDSLDDQPFVVVK